MGQGEEDRDTSKTQLSLLDSLRFAWRKKGKAKAKPRKSDWLQESAGPTEKGLRLSYWASQERTQGAEEQLEGGPEMLRDTPGAGPEEN